MNPAVRDAFITTPAYPTSHLYPQHTLGIFKVQELILEVNMVDCVARRLVAELLGMSVSHCLDRRCYYQTLTRSLPQTRGGQQLFPAAVMLPPTHMPSFRWGLLAKLLYRDMREVAKLTPRHITWTFSAPFSAGLATATEARRAMTAKKRIVIVE
ncbi:hypothetical protein ACMYSQ_007172 [Aspergillus niger]